jgi:tetratricopeptide (TPR) repeat protein
MPFRYPCPESDQEFEDLCVALLRLYWKRPLMKRYGIPGQSQHGVDIIDPAFTKPFYAAQCKLRETHKTFRGEELRAEIDAAKEFTPKLDHYAIVTTAKIPTDTDDELVAINREHAQKGLFTVEIIKYDNLVESFPHVLLGSLKLGWPVHADIGLLQTAADLSDIKVRLDTLLERSAVGVPSDEISDALKDVAAKRYSVAHRELTRVRERRWDGLTTIQRYDVAANLAICCIALNQPLRAAELFLEAAQFKPNDERARTNVVLAYALNESTEKAHSLAGALMQEFPASTRVASLWVSTAPREAKLQDLELTLTGTLVEDIEVAVALGYAALSDEKLDKAEEYALRATSKAPTDPRAWLLLGVVLIRKEVNIGLGVDSMPVTHEQRERIVAAKTALDRAVSCARSDNSVPLLVSALVQRSTANELLGDSQGRKTDIHEAFNIDSTRLDVKRNYAALQASDGDTSEAIKTLRSIPETHRDHGTRYLLGALLAQRRKSSDKEDAVTLFRTIGTTPGIVPPGLRSHVLHVCIELGDDPADLDVSISAIRDNKYLDALETQVLECRVLIKKGDLEGAKFSASEVIRGLPQSPPSHSLLRLCELLSDLKLYREAFPFWKRVTNKPEVHEMLHRRFLEAAYYAGEDDGFIDRCELLRSAGLADSTILHAEVDVLEKYDIELCIDILKKYLQSYPDDAETRLRLSVYGYRLDRADLINASRDSMPDVHTVRPSVGLAAVQLQKMCGDPQAALEYAYVLSRLHPDNPDAQRAMLFALHPFGAKLDVPQPRFVACDTSVQYVEEGLSSPDWLTIESCERPARLFPSIAPDSQLAKELVGKSIGESFVLAESPLKNRIATVVAIQSKYVYLYQSILNTWQIRFPGQHDVYSVRVVNEEGSVDLGAINSAIDRRSEHVNNVLDAYSKLPVPVHMFGEALGVTEIDSAAYLGKTAGRGVRCCGGNMEERGAAHSALQKAKSIVIDLTAIGTLILLGDLEHLKSMPVPVVVAQETINSLLEMLLEQAGVVEAEGGIYTKIGANFGFIPVSKEEKQARAQRLAEIVAFLREHCEVASCRDLSKLPPKQRDELISAFGLAGAQSIVLAKKENSVLWTDDWTVASFANGLGASRVWTQMVLFFLSDRRLMPSARVTESMAKLIAYGHDFTWTNEYVLAAAFRLSEWNPREWPLSGALDQIRSNSIDLVPLLCVLASFMSNLEKQNISEETIRQIVSLLLSRLAVRNDSVHAFQILRRDLPKFVNQKIKRDSIKIIPAFLDWLSHFNAVNYHRL